MIIPKRLTADAVDVDPYTVGQYIWLKDKHGVKIFTGDIVRILHSEWISKSQDDPRSLAQYLIDIANIGYIDFDDDRFAVRTKSKKYNEDIMLSLYIGNHGYIEVIGNIHDNPEFLEELE